MIFLLFIFTKMIDLSAAKLMFFYGTLEQNKKNCTFAPSKRMETMNCCPKGQSFPFNNFNVNQKSVRQQTKSSL